MPQKINKKTKIFIKIFDIVNFYKIILTKFNNDEKRKDH